MDKKEEKERYGAERRRIKAAYEQMLESQEEHSKNPPAYDGEAFISLRGINKVYPNFVHAVHDFDLDINRYELVVFLGPSGCGKSTTLRMIAGLEDITTGELFIDGRYSNEDTPKKRGVSMVFQNYALYPHMSVYDNIAFGLQVAKLPKEEIDDKVKKTAEILQIEDYLYRKPKELSGGQRQRVALGRAIARDAKVFLMDEPLSNLDAKLRVSMRSEIIRLHRSIKATTIYVTHDQAEAMTMADRIVVMKEGYIQQVGEPETIYNHPGNLFVASFIGSPAMNLVEGVYDPKQGAFSFGEGFVLSLGKKERKFHKDFYEREIERVQGLLGKKVYEQPDLEAVLTYHKEPLSLKTLFKKKEYPHIKEPEEKKSELEEEMAYYRECLEKPHPLVFGIRPEDIRLEQEVREEMKASAPLNLSIELVELLGSEYHVHAQYGQIPLVAKVENDKKMKGLSEAVFRFDLRKMHLFDKRNGRALF